MRRWIENWLLRRYFKLTPNQIFTTDKLGNGKINGIILSKQELSRLDQEIKYLETTRVWELLLGTTEEAAQRVIMLHSSNFDNIRSAKMMLYALDVQKKVISNIKKLYAKSSKEPKTKEKEKAL